MTVLAGTGVVLLVPEFADIEGETWTEGLGGLEARTFNNTRI
jgi:hypothetical protein